ncbi:MFS transporter [Cellulomonas shaoxiangyii]|uniref:MFS transporter n=1 Tax=Cellulomonas shaoxiangyii TaxID=2566013 RepID=A0A4P7SKU7_9CELL|nr:MFS transporter [Cellulomonas shaoxiangyii]QCB94830.1 MFS transporter [Cellulomonas shaoxiangyii]TGY86560.1 MFS transporter [Cellulomonas shaoxiangyii]
MPTPGHRSAFWWLWTSSGLSNAADGVLKTALPLVALRYTDSPVVIAGIPLALTLPWLLVSLPAGALADRWDRRRTMLVANLVRAVAVLALVVVPATGIPSMWLLYGVAFALGTAEVFHDTCAQSILPQVVGRDELDRANGRLYAVEMTANQFVGPPLGGFLVAAGVAVAMGAPALLWGLAVGALLMVRGAFRAGPSGGAGAGAARTTSLWAEVGEGLRFLWRRPVLRTLALMVGVSNLAESAMMAVFVLWAVGPDSPLGLSEPGYGALMTSVAVGAVIGSLCAARVADRLGRTLALALCILVAAASHAVPALTTSVLVVAGVWALAGAGIAVWNVVTVSLRQRLTPDHLLGRLNSAYRLLAWGTMPVGALLGGLVAQRVGLVWVFAVATALDLVLLLCLPVLRERHLRAAEREAGTAPHPADEDGPAQAPRPAEGTVSATP